MRTQLIILFLLTNLFVDAQTVCNPNGNLMLYTNYDGGTLTINVDQNIPNLKIGICSYEACYINLTGTFLGNVTEVRYAGYNGSNNTSCGTSIPTTTIIGASGTATTTIVYAPAATVVNSNGYGSIICGYSCNNNANQGGCNTVDQIEGYFLGFFSGSTLFAHKVQYGCWTGTHSVSLGGNCCPPPPVYPGVVAGSQTVCSGSIPAALTSLNSATVSAGTITYQWQSSTTSSSSGFSNISGANAATYAPAALSQTSYYRRAASTVTNNVVYSNVLTVNATPLPSVTISGTSSLCAGMTTTLSANGGTSYAWSSGVANGNSVVITPTVSTVITITCFPASGCSVTASQIVIVSPAPPLFLNSPSSPFLCVGDTSYLSVIGANNCVWEPGTISGNSFTFVAQNSVVYTVTATYTSGCIQTKTVYINPKPLPNVVVPFNNITSCSGQLVHLVVGPQNLVGVSWLPAVPLSGNVYPTTSTVYTVVGIDNNTCKGTATVSITVLPSPTITLSSSVNKICNGETLLITVVGGNSYTLANTSQAYSSGSITVSPTITTNYTVTGDGSNGCLNSAVKTITVSTCTGIQNNEVIGNESQIKVYPNPNNGEFLITGLASETIDIIDNSGRTVSKLNLNEGNNYKVSITNLPAGIYFVLSSGELERFKQKIIVLK
ncbi:T9SS type A sorting domain-containing protein [Aurantibacillus circumpalustris]|uniref:T9SS type A sorting domain-containing protein n=1 Tax=Aurantibacillus circumpalustris TaxID=3036359 RepID=UPI00295B81A5|nr:T9SS type A sorting domain-containing protein [Aurantibacillus circumpalustris]